MTIRKIEALVQESVDNSNQSLAHRFDHLSRVRLNALEIAKYYKNVDKEVLGLAALLHDADQPFNKKVCHVQRSMERAKKIMKAAGIAAGKRKKVLVIISEHSTEDLREKTSLESKILFDADKLDGLGPIGIARVFVLCGQQGKSVEESVEWYEKKIKAARSGLQTKHGKQEAKKLLPFTLEFLRELKNFVRKST